ncbi:MAG: DUF1573 domain-containing protein [Muribaculaceae bacterium]|jgi:hypothetical protein|nr:DUF1573 domain-containing protein [Muribaculaceae bacterium]
MRRILVAFWTLILSAVTMVAGDGPQITFETKSHDFGTIKESDGVAECVFEFQNTGDEPLVLLDVRTSCGCTTPSYPRDPIAPGVKSKIKVSYNPAGRPGEFERTVKIFTNAKKRITLKLSGIVVPKD